MDGAKVLKAQKYKDQSTVLPLKNIYSVTDNLFDLAFDKALSTSLELRGMINPILVCTDEDFKRTDIASFERRQVDEEVSQKYRCLIGNNRYKYAKLNQYTHIDCIIVSSLAEVRKLHRETQLSPRQM